MRNKNYDLKRVLLSSLFISFIFLSCQKDEEAVPVTPVTYEQADISKITSLGVFSTDDIQEILDDAGADLPFIPKYAVEALSVNYYSCNKKGNIIPVSGVFFIPQGGSEFPFLSIQHGTETKRNKVASVSPKNSIEGIVGLLTASLGYVTAAPDYPGFGISNTRHPYLHAASLVPSVVDFMLACKQYCATNHISMNGEVFLTGYSEGGYLSLLTQKVLEEEYASVFKLTAVAPLSGPYDLLGTIDSAFQIGNYSSPAYAAYFLSTYNDIYGWNRLDDIFNPSYTSIIPQLFDGNNSWGEVIGHLPVTFPELVNIAFIESYNKGYETAIKAALEENTLLDWAPQTPLHFFHGDADDIVPYENVLTAIERLSAKGGTNIRLTCIEGGTHESSGPAAISGAITWFEEIRINGMNMSAPG